MISIIFPQGPASTAPHLDSLAQRVHSVARKGHLLLPAWVSTFKRWDLWTTQFCKVICRWKRAAACREGSGSKRQKSPAVHLIQHRVWSAGQDVCSKSGFRRAEASSEARNGVIVGAAFTKFIFCPRWTVNHDFFCPFFHFFFLFSYSTLDELSIKTFICLLFLEQHIRKSRLSLHKLLIPTVKRLQPKQSKLIGKIWWLSFLPAAIQNLIPSPCHLCCSMKKPKAAVWPSCTWEQMLKLLESSYKYYLCIYLSILTNINANTVWPSYTWESHC